MTAYTIEKTGTVTISNGSKALAGTSTLFALRACEGGILLINGVAGFISSVESDTAATLEQEWAGDDVTDASYVIGRATAVAARQANTQDKVADLARILEGKFYYGPDVAYGTSLEDRNAFNGENKGFAFVLISGGAPVLYVRDTATAGVWTDAITIQGPQGPQGAPGENGQSFDYSGSGAPSNAFGVNGQTYLDIDNGDTYLKASGAWGSPVGSVKGDIGNKGWTAEPSVVTDGLRAVIQIADFIGGEGTKPSGAGLYVGVAGLVPDIEDAIDIRGQTGAQGPRGVNFQGAWNSGFEYLIGDLAIDEDASSEPAAWISLTANTSSKPRDNPSDWAYFPGSFPDAVNDGIWGDTITSTTNDGVWGA